MSQLWILDTKHLMGTSSSLMLQCGIQGQSTPLKFERQGGEREGKRELCLLVIKENSQRFS